MKGVVRLFSVAFGTALLVVLIPMLFSEPFPNPLTQLPALPGQSETTVRGRMTIELGYITGYEMTPQDHIMRGFVIVQQGVVNSVFFALQGVTLSDAERLWGRPDRVETSLWGRRYYWDSRHIQAASSLSSMQWSPMAPLTSISLVFVP